MLDKGSDIIDMLRAFLRTAFSFSSEVQKVAPKASTGSTAGITFYKDGQLTTRTAITLKKEEDIEAYVIKTVQNYFRTTYKQGNALLTQA